MEKKPIKLGDTVKVIVSNGYNLSKDDIGTVTQIDDYSIRVTVPHKKDYANWSDRENLKLLKNKRIVK